MSIYALSNVIMASACASTKVREESVVIGIHQEYEEKNKKGEPEKIIYSFSGAIGYKVTLGRSKLKLGANAKITGMNLHSVYYNSTTGESSVSDIGVVIDRKTGRLTGFTSSRDGIRHFFLLEQALEKELVENKKLSAKEREAYELLLEGMHIATGNYYKISK
jgi:hypothetical protein